MRSGGEYHSAPDRPRRPDRIMSNEDTGANNSCPTTTVEQINELSEENQRLKEKLRELQEEHEELQQEFLTEMREDVRQQRMGEDQ